MSARVEKRMKGDSTRRHFLARAFQTGGAVALPYLIPASALGRDGAIAPSERIVLGGIGRGPRGKYDLSAMLPEKDVQFVAICDVQRSRREDIKRMADGHYKNTDCVMYSDMFELLARLKERNADTIFGALGDELATLGIRLLPASSFMEAAMPPAGLLSRRAPDEREQRDINLGRAVAKATSALNIGQTVVVKEGTILAVEAFEGTDETLKRAGKLGGPGAVIVKVARRGHDMRFDIPVVGLRTLKTLKRIRASALAVEAGRTILLDRDEVLDIANRMGLAFVALSDDAPAKE